MNLAANFACLPEIKFPRSGPGDGIGSEINDQRLRSKAQLAAVVKRIGEVTLAPTKPKRCQPSLCLSTSKLSHYYVSTLMPLLFMFSKCVSL